MGHCFNFLFFFLIYTGSSVVVFFSFLLLIFSFFCELDLARIVKCAIFSWGSTLYHHFRWLCEQQRLLWVGCILDFQHSTESHKIISLFFLSKLPCHQQFPLNLYLVRLSLNWKAWCISYVFIMHVNKFNQRSS